MAKSINRIRNKPPRRILVRAVNWIGDAVMTTPALGRIRAAFPDAEIVIVANLLVAQMFTHHPYCDRVIVFDKKGKHAGVMGFLRFCRMLRRERFGLAILFQNAIEAALMAALALIPHRAGYRTDGRGLLLNFGVLARDSKHGLHHVDYYLSMLDDLDLTGDVLPPILKVRSDEQGWAGERLPGKSWVAINPGAAYGSAKRWIPERFAEVADHLVTTYGVRIVLTGGPAEGEIGADIVKSMQHRPLNLIGQTSVRQMMAVLERCILMVTNDSGPMHVGAALGVPIVAIFGPTDHTTTSPRTTNCRIVRHHSCCSPCMLRQCPTDHRCMEGVTAEHVLAAATQLLGDDQ